MTEAISNMQGTQPVKILHQKPSTKAKSTGDELLKLKQEYKKESEIAKIIMEGRPLITHGITRTVNGQQVTTPTNEPLTPAEIKEALKNKKLDKDTRLTYELELKRQQQGGYLTREQAEQIYDKNERAKEKFWNKITNGKF